MSVFSAPTVGSAEAIGSRYGDISGTSTDIIYPVSKLVGDQYHAGLWTVRRAFAAWCLRLASLGASLGALLIILWSDPKLESISSSSCKK